MIDGQQERNAMILKCSRLGHPVLRKRAVNLDVDDIRKGAYRQLVDDMLETMVAYEGVGLAGPQVHLSSRIFVYAVDEAIAKRRKIPELKAGVVFNATYEPIGDSRVDDWEGCLSVPFLIGKVPRWNRIRVRGIGSEGEPIDIEMSGFPARIFQHEIDHTDGRVYLDRMPDLTTLSYNITI